MEDNCMNDDIGIHQTWAVCGRETVGMLTIFEAFISCAHGVVLVLIVGIPKQNDFGIFLVCKEFKKYWKECKALMMKCTWKWLNWFILVVIVEMKSNQIDQWHKDKNKKRLFF